MKIMYVAQRYHTNQIDTVKGFIDNGDEVKYICYYTSKIEDYSLIKPVVLGFSAFSRFINFVYISIIKRNQRGASNIRINYGIPPVHKLKKLMKEFDPDVLVVRDRTIYSIVANSKKPKKTASILYNQSPYYDEAPKTDLRHKIVYSLTPKYRYTPVMGTEGEGRAAGEHDYFLPFVIAPHCKPSDRSYFADERINIMCIGVFTPRKNHMMLFDAVDRIRKKTGINLHLTLVGEAVEDNQVEFLETVKEYIASNDGNGWTDVLTNLTRQEVFDLYLKNDLFVIPSTDEPASVSQLEAMSFGLPAIVSDSNGTACYTTDGDNGYRFRDMDGEDLEEKISRIVTEREVLRHMADRAYQSIVKNNSFEIYYEGIQKIVDDIRRDEQTEN